MPRSRSPVPRRCRILIELDNLDKAIAKLDNLDKAIAKLEDALGMDVQYGRVTESVRSSPDANAFTPESDSQSGGTDVD